MPAAVSESIRARPDPSVVVDAGDVDLAIDHVLHRHPGGSTIVCVLASADCASTVSASAVAVRAPARDVQEIADHDPDCRAHGLRSWWRDDSGRMHWSTARRPTRCETPIARTMAAIQTDCPPHRGPQSLPRETPERAPPTVRQLCARLETTGALHLTDVPDDSGRRSPVSRVVRCLSRSAYKRSFLWPG